MIISNNMNLLKIMWPLSPIILSGILHMIVVSKNYCSFLAIPINEVLFGKNKTWRGIVLVPIFTIISLYLVYPMKPKSLMLEFNEVFGLGLLLGIAYVLFELPNSWLKRRAGILPGKSAAKNRLFHTWLDHTDSALGCLIVYYFFLHLTLSELLACYLLGVIIHFLVNYLLFIFKLRKQPL